ncbi:hypothetical protein ABT337_14540 [Saccharopolyspora hirsuta]|uniref:Uncharacterized protein n=1 Tax=Saccharopolyspora hirsuta TaxID=1837 RepID=A0A5M7C974_SACHI|nr:hypothetical protein [Saccharopolyspora hirsuta]KAA5836261.1 hypothetical protein F1721_08070 [Saccharopolyspora hirsuta]
MSRRDRTTGAARPWRLLGRALVVAGATVAGTSAAWLLDHGPADAAEQPAAETEADRAAADSPETGRSGPEAFSLTRLDPLRLVSSGPAGKLLDAAEPVTEVLQQPAAEVGQVASDALAVTGTQTSTPDPATDSGPAVPPPPPAETVRPALAAPPVAAAATPAPEIAEPTPAPRPAEPQRLAPPAPEEPPAQPGVPVRSAPFVLPSTPGAPGLGGSADGPHHNTTALGWYPAAPVRVPAFAGTPACDLAGTLVSVPEPQPGTTPD